MIHSYEGVERTPAWTELVPVLVVRVPVMSSEQKAGLRAEIASSILDGLLLLEDGLNYKVVDLPLPRAWTSPRSPAPTGCHRADMVLSPLGCYCFRTIRPRPEHIPTTQGFVLSQISPAAG